MDTRAEDTRTPLKEKGRIAAESFIERAEALGYKGKKRDDAALDYFCGLAMGAKFAGDHELAEYYGRLASIIISVRGYFGIKQLAANC